MRLLLVEDDIELASTLAEQLRAADFAVDISGDGVEAEYLGNEQLYDIAVLDLGLPGKSGLEVLRSWRSAGNRLPVIVLTARDAWHERVDGFRAGADDYLGKPFHHEELIARLHALAHRSRGHAGQLLSHGGLTLDPERRRVRLANGHEQELTGTEYRLLRLFMLNPGTVLSKAWLLDHIRDEQFEGGSNLIEVYVRRLRERIGNACIRTRRGQGYVFEVDS
jgi:DNA-binding response OmpR family regulator